MELLETIAKQKPEDEDVVVRLITVEDEGKAEQQRGYLEQMQIACAAIGIDFTWEFAENGPIHARHIRTNHGWKILLDRGLDVFQPYEMNDAFAFGNRLQQVRACKAFEATFIKPVSSTFAAGATYSRRLTVIADPRASFCRYQPRPAPGSPARASRHQRPAPGRDARRRPFGPNWLLLGGQLRPNAK